MKAHVRFDQNGGQRNDVIKPIADFHRKSLTAALLLRGAFDVCLLEGVISPKKLRFYEE